MDEAESNLVDTLNRILVFVNTLMNESKLELIIWFDANQVSHFGSKISGKPKPIFC
jgi:hypothetical protein